MMSGKSTEMDRFSEPVRLWFSETFDGPTPAQTQGWNAISAGENALILAPTGSGKTLAAFLWGIDQLMIDPTPEGLPRTRMIYISPLRALAVDVEKNLRAPLAGVAETARRMGQDAIAPTTAMRTGDTPQNVRRRMLKQPADILITTPESLYLMLTSQARETLRSVEHVIIDEIHAVAGTKRGAHLSLTLERLEELTDTPPQRIGLSATQRPLEEVAHFLGGRDDAGEWRPVTIVDTGIRKELDIEVVVPLDAAEVWQRDTVGLKRRGGPRSAPDEPARRSIWPAIHPMLIDLIDAHQSTLIFVNARRHAERLATELNQAAADAPRREDPELLRASERSERIAPRREDPAPRREDPAPRREDPAPRREDPESLRASERSERIAPRREDPESLRASERSERIAPRREDPAPRREDPAPRREDIVRAHHGSIARERRLLIEDQLKNGELAGLVATSSLELGIDMGAVDLVIQVESPRSVARGLQRIGRAGHQVGEPSRGRIFPKHRADLLEATVVVKQMKEGQIEETFFPRNPLDVLAQQIVAMCALDDWPVDRLKTVVRRSANFGELTDDVFTSVLDLLSGRYPSEEFRELRPRVVWDRVASVIRGRKGAQLLAVTNAGTIPDRGLFGVFLPDGTRVGELDEEMVYESRPGEVFLLGASTWRIQEITFERVVVTPAAGEPGRMPFWRGEGPGRPIELGRAIGQFTREVREHDDPVTWLQATAGVNEAAAQNLVGYLDEQVDATGALPDDRTVVAERFRDEIGDWRVCLHTPFGARVHAPWAMAIRARINEEYGTDVEMLWSDDGIVMRLPEAMDDFPVESLLIHPDEIDQLVIDQLPNSALFASRFREAAGRALLLPRRRPGQRTPLWQQRQRAADLLTAAAKYPDFPILLETIRECVTDVFDLPALRQVLTGLDTGAVRMVSADTPKASPFAQSLLFGWIAVYMYEGDAPVAERRAAALALDRDLLRELLGAEELRELLDADVLAQMELELQRLVENRWARDADELHDVIRELGPLDRTGLVARSAHGADIDAWIAELLTAHRLIELGPSDAIQWAAAEDAGRLRDALGVSLPLDLPEAFTEPVEQPLREMVVRYAHTHGPFTTRDLVEALGIAAGSADDVLHGLRDEGRLVNGEFRPGGIGREWVDADVLRRLRRRSLASLRKEVEPVDVESLGRFLPDWQGVGVKGKGTDALVTVLTTLQGAALPLSVLESDILPDRMAEYRPAELDALCTSGEIVWVGAGSIGQRDGRVRLMFRDQARFFVPPAEAAEDQEPVSDVHAALRDHLAERGASFWAEMVAACNEAGVPYDDETVVAALWDLVWAGEVTNDSLAPLRALGKAGVKAKKGTGSRGGASSRSPRRGRPRPGRLRAQAHPAGVGRWSLVAPMLLPVVSPTERAHARATQLLERYGVLTREMALAEGAQGGFAGVYPVLRALEEQGTVRRGYFVAGLGAAQFALPGAVDRLRSTRDTTSRTAADVVVLASTDPAQPYGAAVSWPASLGRPARTTGTYVALHKGQAVAYLERGGKGLITFAAADELPATDWLDAFGELVTQGRIKKLELARIDGESADESPRRSELEAAGFRRGYKGWTR